MFGDYDLQQLHQQSRRPISQRGCEGVRWASSISCYGGPSLFFSKSRDRGGRTLNSPNSRRMADVQRRPGNHRGTSGTIYKPSESRGGGGHRGRSFNGTSGAYSQLRETSRESTDQLDYRVVFE